MNIGNARYKDRTHAGMVLAEALKPYANRSPIVFAIPNGGIAVAKPVAEALNCVLRLIIIRKIQIPFNIEAGFGAVDADGTALIDAYMADGLGLTEEQIETQRRAAEESVSQRTDMYGPAAVIPDTTDSTVILVDDGLAGGSSMESAVRFMHKKPFRGLIVAAPTASPRAVERIRPLVDELVCPHVGSPGRFAVADAYRLWRDIPDAEAVALVGGR